MDKEAQGENSSSQNVNIRVTTVKRGVHGEITSFGFSDGSSFFIHPELAIEYSVKIGIELSPEKIQFLQLQSIVYAARDKGVEYLAVREHSSLEILNKLKKKGYDHSSASKAVILLQEKNYLNDERFAKMWLKSRLKRHPEGRSSLVAGLSKKGISRKICEKILVAHFSEELEKQMLNICIKKFLRTKTDNPEKLLNHLIRRGFRYGDIKKQISGIEKIANKNSIEVTDRE